MVVGFPLCSSLAMRTLPASHGAVINGAAAVRHRAAGGAVAAASGTAPRFWTCAAIGSAIVIAYALRATASPLRLRPPVDAGGGADRRHRLRRRRPAAAHDGRRAHDPVVAGAGAAADACRWPPWLALPRRCRPARAAWGAFAYVTLVSQIAGFFAWYNGLALGGIARVGQVQLLQAFFTIAAAASLFGEPGRAG
ncbi:MAG: hypothetical protein MZW92_48090 [Comamonadaceae bacterium]|nr:hypothetical protein [Comamonadaceae bacterium]